MTTIGLDKPFAVKDHAGTVARPLLVSTSADVKKAPVIVSRHFDAGTCTCPQLSYGVPIASASAGRGSRTLAEKLDPSPKSMRVVPSIDWPAYTESSNLRNVPLYQRFGFAVIQEISLPEDGPTLWTMLRTAGARLGGSHPVAYWAIIVLFQSLARRYESRIERMYSAAICSVTSAPVSSSYWTRPIQPDGS
jgi:hypothetical protein